LKYDYAVFELSEQTDGQTNKYTHHNTLHPPGGEVKRNQKYKQICVRYNDLTITNKLPLTLPRKD